MNAPSYPVTLVARRVAQVDPALAPEQVAAAIDAVVAHPAGLRELTRALEAGPDALLAGAPPTVGRLVVELRARGSMLPEPVCARCGRSDRPLTASAEGGVCPRCRRRQLAVACNRCGVVKPVAARDNQGRALCAACAPRPRRPCAACGRVRVIARRAGGDDGDLCEVCYRGPVATCGVCGRDRPCNWVTQGHPTCRSCTPRRSAPCVHCGEVRPPSVRWPEGPVCEPCYRAALDRRGTCEDCGTERRLVAPPGPGATRCAECAGVAPLATCRACGAEERPYSQGRCARCTLAERVRVLLAGPDGVVVPALAPVATALAAAPQPYSALNWVRSGAGARLLTEIASGPIALTHEALDAHPQLRAAEFLRQMLVANGVLVPRDEALVRLEAWVAGRLDELDSPERRRLLRSYARWRLLRRARQRAATGTQRARTPTRHAKTRLLAAIAFCDYLDRRGRDLASCSQADVDTWLTHGPPSAPEVRDFLDWAADRKLTQRLTIPSPPRKEGASLDDDTRWATIQRLLHDKDIELTDRVAGCLVLLYGCQLSRLVAITLDQITTPGDDVFLRLGNAQVVIPEPLGGLLAELATTRRPYTGVGTPPQRTWLFPGLDPGRPLHPGHLGERLRRLGIGAMPSRRAALTHLAARLPAAVLADLLGIHPNTAVRWVRAAGGDWTSYAAQLVKQR